MKIALAQLNYHIGNLAYNYEKIANAIAQARKNEAEIIVFSELSVCGYPPMDMLEYSSFIEECNSYVGKIADLCTDIACVIGSPMVNTKAGKALFNSALFLYEGKILAQVNKSLLPDYDVFDEYRYFEANEQFSLLDFKGKKIAITICEDIWDSDYKLYHTKPVESLTALQPDIFINISASPSSGKITLA